MSILCKGSNGWILDHSDFIKNIYCNVDVDSKESSLLQLSSNRFSLKNKLFEIITPFAFELEAAGIGSTNKLKRKRTHVGNVVSSSINSQEVCIVKSALEQIVAVAKEKGYFSNSPSEDDFLKNNKEARDCSILFFSDVCREKMPKCEGGNTAEVPVLVNIYGQAYLIPNGSKFFCCDVQTLSLPKDSKFDFILLDPPWWNKYVRRRKTKQETAGYKMMYNEEVGSLPVSSWLAPHALVAIWCTNCTRHSQDVITQWFPKWGLHHTATWFWVKVTQSGQPVCQFSPPQGKQPYERILFGAPTERQVDSPPDNKCIVSVPSAIHSHKPPLSDVMKPYLPAQPRSLELFARYLLPHWTSAGDQVLALQNVKLFTQIQESGS